MASSVKDAAGGKIGVAEYLEENTERWGNKFLWIALATVLALAIAGSAFLWVRRSSGSNTQ